MTASTIQLDGEQGTAGESALVTALTDKAIARDIAKYERMAATRDEQIAELEDDRNGLLNKRDLLLDEVARRAQAKKTRPTKENDTAQ